jgi:hypothetical protein
VKRNQAAEQELSDVIDFNAEHVFAHFGLMLLHSEKGDKP